ncbi:beta-lactamase family protein [Sphingomonas sp. SUN019]|uniref:serine hydrolase domain-containing protein n=1 Tax=Sphingomonas sp. SUN019 TaxID=2937788 RepID=UPI002164D817|nr:serine hydrolase domain-containing protein [Sphingomonas sp. SUN019]UVO51368.1 beta-lactamase family protein [Sphingomonas sp. SUN019]
MIRALRFAAALIAVFPAAANAKTMARGMGGVQQVIDGSDIRRGGEVIVSRSDKVLYQDRWGSGITAASGKWRWASVTKQVIATLVMQEVAAGRVDLDQSVATYLPTFASPNAKLVTVRQLLRHQSGLPNPDDTAASPDAIPAYDAPGYKGSRDPLTGYCAGPVKGPPGGDWSYNNCDYVVAGALLKAVTGKDWPLLVRERIAGPYGMISVGSFPTPRPVVSGTIGGKPDSGFDLAAFGAAAGLYGTARDLWKFDRALMKDKLLPAAARAEMWDGHPQLGSIALGQWSFTAPLKGCPHPVRVVERRGQIGGVQVRNFIMPEWDAVVIVFADRAELDFGEVWQGKGFSHDLLAAAVCA